MKVSQGKRKQKVWIKKRYETKIVAKENRLVIPNFRKIWNKSRKRYAIDEIEIKKETVPRQIESKSKNMNREYNESEIQ